MITAPPLSPFLWGAELAGTWLCSTLMPIPTSSEPWPPLLESEMNALDGSRGW